jgi:predicted peptidase
MLPLRLLAIAVALTLPMNQMHAQDTQQVKTFKKKISRTVTANYLLFLPKGCEPKGKKRWPLILFLHGAGERGTDIRKVAVHGPPKIVQSQPDFPFIVVSPQCPDGETWSSEVLLNLLDAVMAKYPVDPHRVYLTGLSMGGYGSWSLGLEHPERFAAIAPICGGGEPVRVMLAGKKRVADLKSLGVWAFHGAKDPVVPLAESERMVQALQRVGCTDVKLTVYPEAQHDSWTEAYNDSQLYDWLLRHSR